MKKAKYYLISCLILISFSASTYSATKTWTGTTSTDWSVGSNWGGTAPVSNDNILIPTVVSGRYPVISTSVLLGTGSVSINSNSGAGGGFTISSGGSLTTTGLITILANGTFTMINGTAKLNGITSSGSIDVQGGTITSTGNITISSGTLSQSGGLIHMATNTGTNPTVNLVINGGIVTQSGGTFYTKDFAPSAGTFNQTGLTAVFKIFHDWKPTSGHTFNSTSGTVQFTGVPSTGATFVSTNSQFNNVIIDASIDPGFDNVVNSVIKISGDLTNSNLTLINSINATFIFNGSGIQMITSSSTNFFGNLTVNKSGGLVSLASNISVTGTLSMTSGNFNTGVNTLTLGSDIANRGTFLYTSGVIITGSTGGFKRWFINSSVSNRVFPVGTTTSNNSIILSFTGAPSTGGTLTARFIPLDPGTNSYAIIDDAGYSIDTYSSVGYWQIEAGDGLTDGIYSLSLRGHGFNPSGTEITNYAHLRVLKRTGPGFNWVTDGTHINATGSNSDPTFQRGGLSGFSQFAMGGNIVDGNPLQGLLPVKISLFSFKENSNNVVLNWVTESEKNNKGFEIYRKNITDDWQKIGFVAGSGNSNTKKTYTFNDNNLSSNTYNYRLKQLDYNGNFEYFILTSQVVIGIPLKYDLKQNYPNPFNPSTTIEYSIPVDAFVSLKIFDFSGREITDLGNTQKKAGFHSVVFNSNTYQLASGIYFYKITAGSYINVKKLMLIK
jgi:hypothetical protein